MGMKQNTQARHVTATETVEIHERLAIEIPAGYSYTLCPEEITPDENHSYYIQIQKTADCDFSEANASEFNLLVNMDGLKLQQSYFNLSSEEAQEEINKFLDGFGRISKPVALRKDNDVVAAGFSAGMGSESIFVVFCSGTEHIYSGMIVFGNEEKTEAQKEAEIRSWMQRFRLLSLEERTNLRQLIFFSKQYLQTFEKQEYANIDGTLQIPIPDGYHYSIDPKEIGNANQIVVVPEDYPLTADPMDAEIGMTVTVSKGENEYDIDRMDMLLCVLASQGYSGRVIKATEKMAAICLGVGVDSERPRAAVQSLIFYGPYMATVKVVARLPYRWRDILCSDLYRITDNWMGRIKTSGEPKASQRTTCASAPEKIKFQTAAPDEQLCEYYQQKRNSMAPNIPGVRVVMVDASGPAYYFMPLREGVEAGKIDWGDNEEANSDEEKAQALRIAAGHVCTLPLAPYRLDQYADVMARLFRVTKEAFNRKEDREAEIRQGYLSRTYQFSALRSFAWTLQAYCASAKVTVADVSLERLEALVRFISEREWLNYSGDSFCRGLCAYQDMLVYFLPDATSNSDREKFLPDEETMELCHRTKESFPNFHGGLDAVASLEALRDDLAVLLPAILRLWEKLRAERDPSQALTGDEADIVYAWCAMARAAREPFYMQDSPMLRERYSQYSDEPEMPEDMVRQLASLTETGKKTAEEKTVDWAAAPGAGEFLIRNGVLQAYLGSKSEVLLPKEVTEIGPYAFWQSRVTKVKAESTLKEIGMFAFAGCRNLKKYNAGFVRKIAPHAFDGAGLREVIELNGMIDSRAFAGCQIEKVGFSEFVDEIADDAFDNKEKLKVLCDKESKGMAWCERNHLSYDIDAILIFEDEDIPETPAEAFAMDGDVLKYNRGSGRCVAIPAGVRVIGAYAFADSNLEKVRIPAGVERIEKGAFSCCELDVVHLPESIRYIGAQAFENNRMLREISLKGVREIEKRAFAGAGLWSLTIPASVRKIGDEAFDTMGSAEQLTIEEGVEEIGEQAFACPERMRVVVPVSAKRLEHAAFGNAEVVVEEGSHAAAWAAQERRDESNAKFRYVLSRTEEKQALLRVQKEAEQIALRAQRERQAREAAELRAKQAKEQYDTLVFEKEEIELELNEIGHALLGKKARRRRELTKRLRENNAQMARMRK